MSFELTTLGEYISIQGGYAYKSQQFIENSTYPVLKIKNIRTGYVDINDCAYIDKNSADETERYIVSEGDVLISLTGSGPNAPQSLVGRVARFWDKGKRAWVNQRVGRVVLKKDKTVHKDFIFYFLGTKESQNYLVANSSGSANQANINGAIIEALPFPRIDYSTSKKISKVLRTLDEKINLNNQINQTLESIAQAIFKSWFIDFEPVRAKIAAKQTGQDPELAAMCAISGKTQAELDQLTKEDFAELQATAALFPDELVESELGTVPKGWSVQKIKDFGRVICGKTPSKSIAEYYGNDIPFIKIPDMHHDVFVLDSFEKLSEKGSNSQANKILPRGSICVSCIATVGKVIITHQPSQTNQQINSIVPDLPIYTYFLYFLMGEKERLFHDLASGGSATLNMNTSTFSNVDILMPNSKIIEAYDGVVSRIFDEILHNLKLSFLLSDMRDTLLPKLLSGELDVSDLQSEGD